MRKLFRTAATVTFAISMLAIGLVAKAGAQCGPLNPSDTESSPGPGQFLKTSLLDIGQTDRIVGFWKAKFVSEGTTGIPDGTVIDSPFVQWHSDGTEIMNSTRVPATGSFCLGVWQSTKPSSYTLNHFALSYTPAGDFVGPGQIRENITLSKNGNQYSGTFTIAQYDPEGNLLEELKGNVTAFRITQSTTIDQVL
jgi:hypothetical protein